MKEAVERVLTRNVSIRSVAKEFNLLQDTLASYVQKIRNGEETTFVARGNSCQVFTEDEEIDLKSYLEATVKKYNVLSTVHLAQLVYRFAVERKKIYRNFVIPSSWLDQKKSSYDWVRRFMLRHPDFSLRAPTANRTGVLNCKLIPFYAVESVNKDNVISKTKIK